MIDNTPNQPSKLKIKSWIERNYESKGTYNKENQIRFKTGMLRLNLCDYGDSYILVKGTVKVANTAAQDQPNNAANKNVIYKKGKI